MPHIIIKMYPGRTEETKKDIARKTRDFLMKEMKMDAKYFSVSIEEIEKENWQNKVIDKIDAKNLYIGSDFYN